MYIFYCLINLVNFDSHTLITVMVTHGFTKDDRLTLFTLYFDKATDKFVDFSDKLTGANDLTEGGGLASDTF